MCLYGINIVERNSFSKVTVLSENQSLKAGINRLKEKSPLC